MRSARPARGLTSTGTGGGRLDRGNARGAAGDGGRHGVADDAGADPYGSRVETGSSAQPPARTPATRAGAIAARAGARGRGRAATYPETRRTRSRIYEELSGR